MLTTRGLLLVGAVGLMIAGAAVGLGTLPDASQEGLLNQLGGGYGSVALFHYRVPTEVTRATWEFASFQDEPDCPSRRVYVHLQHGSYPLFDMSNVFGTFNGSSAVGQTFEQDLYYVERTGLASMSLTSAYRPSGSLVYPVYNPLPGDWFAAAYLESFEERISPLLHKCRYSLGSIAIWNRAKGEGQEGQVKDVFPNAGPSNHRTRNNFSYYKFYVPQEVTSFRVMISGCQVQLRHQRPDLNRDRCIQSISYRAKALPVNEGHKGLSSGENMTLYENRPYQDTTYYVLVVANSEVTFDLEVALDTCGEAGLYGPAQFDWYLDEKGLMVQHGQAQPEGEARPREPVSGFQLFASSSSIAQFLADQISSTFDGGRFGPSKDQLGDANVDSNRSCTPVFDFTRTENAGAFSTGYLLQGRSWFTKWLTVLENQPVFTRFEVVNYQDIGGSFVIRLGFDRDLAPKDVKDPDDPRLAVYGCLSQNRPPRKTDDGRTMICDSREATVKLDPREGQEVTKVIPFPEPGTWYLGLQIKCVVNGFEGMPCPANMRSVMISVNLNLQPCGHSNLESEACSKRGLCSAVHKGHFRFSTCTCVSGYSGWTCQVDGRRQRDANHEEYQVWTRVRSLTGTLLLTLSNLAFLPAVILAVRFRLYAEALVYFAAMVSSTLYHTCDETALHFSGLSFSGFSSSAAGATVAGQATAGALADVPETLSRICSSLYVSTQVLQFCDFYAATLSLWVTLVALARIPSCAMVRFLNHLGVLLVAVLVQLNRTSVRVFLVPISLGLVVLAASFAAKRIRLGRFKRPRPCFVVLVSSALVCAVIAICLFTLVATTYNYPYVHSAWHCLLAASLALLLPECAPNCPRSVVPKVAPTGSGCFERCDGDDTGAGEDSPTPPETSDPGDGRIESGGDPDDSGSVSSSRVERDESTIFSEVSSLSTKSSGELSSRGRGSSGAPSPVQPVLVSREDSMVLLAQGAPDRP